jgi:hypothetical protein
MIVREFHESDLAALRALHSAQGFDYAFPDLRNPLFLTKLVLTDAGDQGRIEASSSDVAPCFSLAPHETAASTGDRDAALKGGATRETTRGAGEVRAGKCDVERSSGAAPIVGAALLRLTAEAYLLLDPRTGTPRERWQWLLALHAAAERDAWQRGLEDVHAWLPPAIAQKFGRRLERLGWRRDDAWTPYCKHL